MYERRVGNAMSWYATANSSFGSDVGAPPGGGFAVNVFPRDGGTVYRIRRTSGRGTEQLSHSFGLIDLFPHGWWEQWQDSPEEWPREPAYSQWHTSEELYGPDACESGGNPGAGEHAAAAAMLIRWSCSISATTSNRAWSPTPDCRGRRSPAT